MQMKQFDSRHDVRLVIPREYRLWEEAEVHFLMEDASKNLLVNDKADYVNKETGEVVYKLKEVDTMKPGCHKAVFRINYGDGTTMSFPQKGYIEVRIERTIHNGRDTHIVEEIALKVSLIDKKFADLSAEVDEWRENVADDVKEKVYDNLDIDRLSNTEVIQARGGKKDLNERITGIDEGLNAHIADKKNPHGTTKNDVGLGNVPNWGAASQADARAGTNNTRMMSPLRTKEAIDAFASEATIIPAKSANVSGVDYPLGLTTFMHSGLGYPTDHGTIFNIKVSNLRFTQLYFPHSIRHEEIGMYFRHFYEGDGWTAFQQVETTSGAQAKVDAHVHNKNNPHGVTKSQIGLGSVDNIKQASKTDFDAHVNNKSNPHAVTKAQVGLGNVDNAKQATKSEFDAHLNNKSNPHGVTKSQVGLGSVPNYPIASQAQAEAGTHTGSFMTPQRTKQAFQSFASEPLNWIRASLQSTWKHSDSWPVRYAKDATGTVYIEGIMNGGAIGGDPAIVQFTLPAGYRPGQTSYYWLVGSSSGTSGAQGLRCYLGANGNFIIQDMTWPGATQFVAVNIVFKAGN